MVDFFVESNSKSAWQVLPLEKYGEEMIKITEQEIIIDESLKKLEFICDFCNTTPTIINGSIRKIDNTNLSYIEPHRVIINNITFLAFNYSNDIYIKNLSNKIKILELETYLKGI